MRTVVLCCIGTVIGDLGGFCAGICAAIPGHNLYVLFL